MDWKAILSALVIAVILGIGGTVASHDRELAGLRSITEATHEDVKEIKRILLEKALE